jgi:acyl dehydratase
MTAPTLLYAEDLPVGVDVDLGADTATHDEIVEFARAWDPLPIHTDDAAAAAGPFGEVIGSGLHTMAIFQRLAVLGAYSSWAMVAGRGVRDVQLVGPLRPGTTVHARLRVVGVRRVGSDRALVTTRGTVSDADRRLLALETDAYVARRLGRARTSSVHEAPHRQPGD